MIGKWKVIKVFMSYIFKCFCVVVIGVVYNLLEKFEILIVEDSQQNFGKKQMI